MANYPTMAEPIVFQRLQAWQDREGVNDDALAERISKGLGRRIHRTTIWRAKRGLRVLGMDIQLELQKHTKISPAEWAEFYAQTIHLRGEGARSGKRPFAASPAKGAA